MLSISMSITTLPSLPRPPFPLPHFWCHRSHAIHAVPTIATVAIAVVTVIVITIAVVTIVTSLASCCSETGKQLVNQFK